MHTTTQDVPAGRPSRDARGRRRAVMLAAVVSLLVSVGGAAGCKRSPDAGTGETTRRGIDANASRILESMDDYAAQLQADKDAGVGEFAPDPDEPMTPEPPEPPENSAQNPN